MKPLVTFGLIILSFKIKPVFENLNKRGKFLIYKPSYSVGEIMVPYYGWHCAKQFINGKPVRQGYIIWSLCTSTGAGVTFKAYCGHKQELRTEVFAKYSTIFQS